MKDLTKVLDRLKKAGEKAGLQAISNAHTVEQGVDILAEYTLKERTKASEQLFKRFAVYVPEHVKTAYNELYSLIADDVIALELKEEAKQRGLTVEEVKEEQELLEELNSIEGKRLIGYARVSTKDQNLARQLKALDDAGCQVVFKEKISGKNTNRPAFKLMMKHLKAGDTIIISELSRIARSTKDLYLIMGELEEKEVSLKSLKETWLDTTTATGKLLFTIMAGISQFEREQILERQAEGIAVAKENGVKFGVKLQKDADLDLAIQLYKEGKYTTVQIAKMCHISRSTLWRNLKKLGLLD